MDSRPFRAHLTLLRHAGAHPREAHPDFLWPVERFALYASEPTARGVRYRELGGWPLLAGLRRAAGDGGRLSVPAPR